MDFLSVEQSVWRRLQEETRPIALYGMGDGADKILAQFDRLGIRASAVFASDEFARGSLFHGFCVRKLSDTVAELGEDIVIVIAFASQRPEVLKLMYALEDKYDVVAPDVPVVEGPLFDEDFVRAHQDEMQRAYDLLADDLSREVFLDTVRFKLSGKMEYLRHSESDKDEVFHNLLRLTAEEHFSDLGAYNGDTIDEFLHYTNGSYKRIIAFEPNAKNFEKLKLHCKGMANVSLWQLGSYSKNTELIFNNKAGRNSAIADKGVATKVATVDTILCGMAAGYIKADVEGADFETLIGMQKTMENCKPKLNFSAYHRFEDIFRLALYIHSVNPDYKIFLRHHPYIPAWDTNLYCI